MTQLPDNLRSGDLGLHGPELEIVQLDESAEVSRRRFLEAAGFSLSLAAVSGCERAPVETALPSPLQPAGAIPGRMQYYASTCNGCPSACGMLVGTRDGRPLKMEGLPEHPLSSGGLCAVAQAQPIGLYDSHRLTGPLQADKPSEWSTVDQEIIAALKKFKEEGSQAVRLVTPTITSPTLQAHIDQFLKQFADAKHIILDSVSHSAILDAHAETHETRVLPHYRFEKAEVIVSFGADFLGTWISPVEFTSGWSSRRAPTEESPQMSYHVQFESRMSLTGTNADHRYSIAPAQQGQLLGRLAEKIAELAGEPLESPLASQASEQLEKVLEELAKRLWNARGKSLVVSDSQSTAVQRVVNLISHQLGNYGSTLDITRPSRQRHGSDQEVKQLITDLQANKVGALLVADVDILHDLPGHESLTESIGKIPLTVSFASRKDNFASIAKYVCPDHHALESWSDAEPLSGLLSLAQPTLRPLGKTRAVLESLAVWSESPTSTYEAIKSHWEEAIFPRRQDSAAKTFLEFWEKTLHRGFVEVKAEETSVGEFKTAAVSPLPKRRDDDEFTLELYQKVGMPATRHSHNPWLHELPDPVTKVTWGNYVCVSPADADKLGLSDGDIVKLSADGNESQLELPVLTQVGQHEGVLAVALAYGCKGTDRFANIGPQWFEARPTVAEGDTVGKNAAGFIEFRDGTQRYQRSGAKLTKTGRKYELAATQTYHSLEVPEETAPHGAHRRQNVEHTTLDAFAKDSHAGASEHHFDSTTQLWPDDHPKTEHAWGMVIDLNKCTGCSACVIACQSENNVPVVGYDEVRRQREMHWMRIDRYFTGEGPEMDIDHQPMMCQHCDNAPCETVCPVLATVHSSEGLNEQVYNRCVGTRYCANNCPYKVRRFNWFKYPHDDSLQNLVLNPDVTVRSRGVMEKCSMCVQRIEAGKIEAGSHGKPVADGAIQTACQQSCPADAIVFGDMNNQESAVAAALQSPRRFRVLEELNVRPAVSYLRVVKNREEKNQHGESHSG